VYGKAKAARSVLVAVCNFFYGYFQDQHGEMKVVIAKTMYAVLFISFYLNSTNFLHFLSLCSDHSADNQQQQYFSLTLNQHQPANSTFLSQQISTNH